MADDAGTARIISRGFAAGHQLAAEHFAARAKGARADDSSSDLIRQSLQLQADQEAKVAAEHAAVADLLDQAAKAPMPALHSNVIRTLDGGAYVWDEDDL